MSGPALLCPLAPFNQVLAGRVIAIGTDNGVEPVPSELAGAAAMEFFATDRDHAASLSG